MARSVLRAAGKTWLGLLLGVHLAWSLTPSTMAASLSPRQVQIVKAETGYQMLLDGRPFHVNGAGLESGNLAQLAASGANSFRTWRTEGGRRVLDRALDHGLMVAMGIEMARERHGFDYDDAAAVARQFARVRREVSGLKDHPALLMWVVGNELNLDGHNPKVWDAVNQIAEWIHQEDPDHPVMTTLAGFNPELAEQLRTRAPALDLIGIQLYGDIVQLPAKLGASAWTGPYIVTEWGPSGHWEVPQTAWGAPIEDDSTRKAELLTDRYRRFIASDSRQCLGSYVFLWGQKQERTPTWYGMFLKTGEATAAVDAMQYSWTGRWPGNRSPSISPLRIDARQAADSVVLAPRQPYLASVSSNDPDGDSLQFDWRLLRESEARSVGGDAEEVPRAVPVRMRADGAGRLQFTSPRRSGNYRLFVTVRDGRGHAAHANMPFRVEKLQARP
ncbi:MAG: hypothetical protein KDI60_02985 [Xanthomonadales bacterium]|nr:hypothetical protein [Xanthomonadales bacterium]MCP5476271.1 hypothetical protein [Rhodanobacteraceae bacterium]